MQIEVELDLLRRSSGFVNRVTSADPSSDGPLDNTTVLTTTPEGLQITCTNRMYQAKGLIKAEILMHGEVSVPSKSFHDWIRNQEGDIVNLVLIEEDLHAQVGRAEAEFATIPMFDNPPSIRHLDDGSIDQIVTPDFADWVSLASFAAEQSGKNPTLSGVHVHKEGLIATDGYMLAIIDFDWPQVEEFTIPLDYVRSFPKPSEYGQGDVSISSDSKRILMSFGDLDMIGPMLQNEYPKVDAIKKMLPNGKGPILEVEYSEFVRGLKSVDPMSPGGEYSPVIIKPSGELAMYGSEKGSGGYKMEGVKCTLPGEVVIQLSILKSVLKVMKGEDKILFKFNDGDDKGYCRKLFSVEKDGILLGLMPIAKNR